MTDEIKCGGEVFKSFAIRNATYEDCAAVLECLRSAFAPYRESYTPEAFLDTVLTRKLFATAYRRCRSLLRRARPAKSSEPSLARFWKAAKGTFAAWQSTPNGKDQA